LVDADTLSVAAVVLAAIGLLYTILRGRKDYGTALPRLEVRFTFWESQDDPRQPWIRSGPRVIPKNIGARPALRLRFCGTLGTFRNVPLAAIGDPFHKAYLSDLWHVLTNTGEIDVLDPGGAEALWAGAGERDTDAVILFCFDDPDGKRHYSVTRFTYDADNEDWWKLRASRNVSNRFALLRYLRILIGKHSAKELARMVAN